MTGLVAYLLLFVGLGIFFVFFHLMLGKLIRPAKPDAEKMTIYECGEPTIGSAWIQFDLRFYVVALLFVIFDVEVAFFFPWAVVFGKANRLAMADLSVEQRYQRTFELAPEYAERIAMLLKQRRDLEVPGDPAQNAAPLGRIDRELAALYQEIENDRGPARQLAWFAFWDIVVFFGVLLVGFAYLWRRGDLDWVRSTAAERVPVPESNVLTPPIEGGVLVGAGREV